MSRPANQDQYRAKAKDLAGRDRSKIPGALRRAQGRLREGGSIELLGRSNPEKSPQFEEESVGRNRFGRPIGLR